jgi:hypothetical protein
MAMERNSERIGPSDYGNMYMKGLEEVRWNPAQSRVRPRRHSEICNTYILYMHIILQQLGFV